MPWEFPTMPCHHLRQLFDVCREHKITLSSTDLIRIVCRECGVSEECPSVLCDEYDGRHPDEAQAITQAVPTMSSKSGMKPAKD